MKLAFADLHQYNADLDHMRVTPAQLLDRDYLRERASLIDPKLAGAPGCGAPRPGIWTNTVKPVRPGGCATTAASAANWALRRA